jgi:hypothetical protein
MNGHLGLSASTTLVWPLLKILIHSYTLCCGKQFCSYRTANCQWISALFTHAMKMFQYCGYKFVISLVVGFTILEQWLVITSCVMSISSTMKL